MVWTIFFCLLSCALNRNDLLSLTVQFSTDFTHSLCNWCELLPCFVHLVFCAIFFNFSLINSWTDRTEAERKMTGKETTVEIQLTYFYFAVILSFFRRSMPNWNIRTINLCHWPLIRQRSFIIFLFVFCLLVEHRLHVRNDFICFG